MIFNGKNIPDRLYKKNEVTPGLKIL